MRLVRTIFGREWRETLRDRRTLMVMLVVPLLFYPLVMGVMGYFGARQQMEMSSQSLSLVVNEARLLELEELADGLKVELAPGQALEDQVRSGALDLALVQDPRGEILSLYYRNTVEGELAADRVEAALDEFTQHLLEERFESLGGSAEMAQPFRFERVDLADVRESAGSRFGGILGYLLIFLGFTGCLATAVDTGAGEKERGTFEAMLASSVGRLELVVAKWAFVFSAGLLSMFASLSGMGLLLVLGLRGLEAEAVPLNLSMLVVIGLLTLFCLAFTSALLVGISLVSQNAKQAQSLTSPVFLVVSVCLIFALLPGTELEGLALATPVLSVALAIRESITGGLSLLQGGWVCLYHLLLSAACLAWVKGRLSREGALLG